MGNFLYGGKRPTNITYQGKDVQTLKYNGVTVWEKFVLEPVTKTFSWDDMGHKTEDYTAPVGATVMRVKRSAYREKSIVYIKINQQHKFRLSFSGTVNGSYYHESTIILYKSVDAYNNPNLPNRDPVVSTVGGSSYVSTKMELSFSEEINNHDFNDSTSDHEHLDWTK